MLGVLHVVAFLKKHGSCNLRSLALGIALRFPSFARVLEGPKAQKPPKGQSNDEEKASLHPSHGLPSPPQAFRPAIVKAFRPWGTCLGAAT